MGSVKDQKNMKNSKKAKRKDIRRGSAHYTKKRVTLNRIKKIMEWLQEGKYPNCTTIARELRVSKKTAMRDLDVLRNDWRVAMAYDEIKHGYHLTENVTRLPWMPVTEYELFTIAISQQVLGMYQGMGFQKPLELAFDKITRALDDEERYLLEDVDRVFSFRPFAPEDVNLKLLELLTRAARERQVVRFVYFKPRNKPGKRQAEVRTVHPYHVMDYSRRLYLICHDLKRNEVRTFALCRMSEPMLTGEQFVFPKGFDPKKHLDKSLGVMSGKGDYTVVIEMDPWLTDSLRGRKLHHSQEISEQPDGISQWRFRLSALEEIEQHVLSWGTHARVIEPPELRESVLKTATALARTYSTNESAAPDSEGGQR